MRRLGIFGGTFDPPHVGHLALAECAREQLALDRVLFVPAGAPPHKRGRRTSAARDRAEMTRLAVRGHRAFALSRLEVERDGPSYTVDTLRAVRAAHPTAALFLLVGSDSLRDLPGWREAGAIASLATLVVARRPGAAARRPARGPLARARLVWLENAGLDVSSSEVRARARAGRSLRYLVPDAVAAYARRRRLYRGRA